MVSISLINLRQPMVPIPPCDISMVPISLFLNTQTQILSSTKNFARFLQVIKNLQVVQTYFS